MTNVNVSSSPSERSAQLQQSRAQIRRDSSSPVKKTTEHKSPRFLNRTQMMMEIRGFDDLPDQEPVRTPQAAEQHFADKEADQAQILRQNRHLTSIQQARNHHLQAYQTQQEEEEDEANQANEKQKETKRKQSAVMRRGGFLILDVLTTAIDTVTGGSSFLITLLLRIPSLVWKNLEMIYGTYFAKGKSRYIPPTSWDPIPMPIDKKGLLLMGFIIAADIALAVAIAVVMFGGFCIMHDIVKFMASPLQAGANLAQGGSEMCLGGIITSIFGL